MEYKKVELTIEPYSPWNEIIINELAEIGFDSFTEENGKVQAYVAADSYDETKLKSLLEQFNNDELNMLNYQTEDIPDQNWNKVWESDFDPVTVDKKLIIYAPFHDVDITPYTYSIEIQPQMSFGTGHHQTTFLLSQVIMDQELKNRSVLDVGTGTGVLGILASKMGAREVFGTDIEEGAYKNALENCVRNQVDNFHVTLGDIDVIPEHEYDLIIANINRNVLIKHLPSYAKKAALGSQLLLSGFFESDIDSLEIEAKKANFRLVRTYTLESWAVMQLIKE